MPAPKTIVDLVERFESHKDAYKAPTYNETQLRREFVDPLCKALGWDIDNEQGWAEAYKDVVHEDAIKIGGNTKAPDYAFRIGGTRKFFLEAKKPSVNIKSDISPAFQLRRYAWSAKLPLSILTDFEEFAVYDCRVKPEKGDKASVARVAYYTFDQYVEKWDEIAAIFSRDSILKGSFDKYADDNKRKRGTAEVDDAFLAEIESWRSALARNVALRNPHLSLTELNTAIQKTIDRIVFLRIAEDRGIEPYGQLQKLAAGKGLYGRLGALFQQADTRYNSGLFHFRAGDGSAETLDEFTLALTIDDKVLKPILSGLYYPDSPYEFSVLPADILGQIYERFLGKVIRLSGRTAIIEDKPEVKKAGGVYYTPAYISKYIVRHTLDPLLADQTPLQISGLDKRMRNQAPLRIIDPACGSGSFLIEAYQYLLDWYRVQYIKDNPARARVEKIQSCTRSEPANGSLQFPSVGAS
ncbi:type I restriction enzyme HsdR N-terminal domain-containing protein [Jiella avicenniae]|uniref:site-specific DNA-methyltransferase (adenine-specific) n=1 Tax=Jiella avicenniae TaxID=2907202 RepID=A0A9X1P6K1_9HYPH|nr:type I restriction enzyme HsdR N-terminal domain-containing protein [Jiella avicenniae]MCE7030704.1 N-6 DNA methylase [Jiella avicenniae]